MLNEGTVYDIIKAMDTYMSFAEVYDSLMEDVPYDEWHKRIKRHLCENGIKDGLVLDLACGTGVMTELLASDGYDMTGIDMSPEMLEQAGLKKEQSGHDILYLCQDMREFELYGTVRAIVCVCDSLNYILKKDELTEVFRLVNNYLDPSGLFLFDINTVHKYRDVIGDTVIAENRDECSFIWENYYDPDEKLNQYDLSLFIKDEESGLYRRQDETHLQRGYELRDIEEALEASGLKLMAVYDADKSEEGKDPVPVGDDTERIFVIAQESGK